MSLDTKLEVQGSHSDQLKKKCIDTETLGDVTVFVKNSHVRIGKKNTLVTSCVFPFARNVFTYRKISYILSIIVCNYTSTLNLQGRFTNPGDLDLSSTLEVV